MLRQSLPEDLAREPDAEENEAPDYQIYDFDRLIPPHSAYADI